MNSSEAEAALQTKRNDGRFALAEGVWTYRITANWTDKTRDYDGTAIYFVCIEKK